MELLVKVVNFDDTWYDFDDTGTTGITCIDHYSLSIHHMSWEALVSRLVKEIDDWLNFLYIINSIPPKIFHLTFYAWNV